LLINGAVLTFAEPIVAKRLLPLLGGTPIIVVSCGAFFLAVLLLGFAYSHASIRLFGVRRQAALHPGGLLLPLLWWGLGPAGLGPPTPAGPGGRVLAPEGDHSAITLSV